MMNLKYYLRGLGIGIIVTALIMGITSGGKKETLSNEEIKERARDLGMTEESIVLADLVSDEAEGSKELEEPENEKPAPTKAVPEPSAGPEEEEELSPSPSRTPEASISPSPLASQTPEASPGLTDAQPQETAGSMPTKTPGKSASPSPETGKAPSPSPAREQIPTASPRPAGMTQGKETITIEIVSGDTSYSISGKLEEAGLVESAYEYDLYLCENGYDKRLNVGTFEIPKEAKPEEIAKILARMQ